MSSEEVKIKKCPHCGYKGPMQRSNTFNGPEPYHCPKCDKDI